MSPHHDFVTIGTFQSDNVDVISIMWSLWKFFPECSTLFSSYKTFQKNIQHSDRAARVVMEMSHRWSLAEVAGSQRSRLRYMQPMAPACSVSQGEAEHTGGSVIISIWIQDQSRKQQNHWELMKRGCRCKSTSHVSEGFSVLFQIHADWGRETHGCPLAQPREALTCKEAALTSSPPPICNG